MREIPLEKLKYVTGGTLRLRTVVVAARWPNSISMDTLRDLGVTNIMEYLFGPQIPQDGVGGGGGGGEQAEDNDDEEETTQTKPPEPEKTAEEISEELAEAIENGDIKTQQQLEEHLKTLSPAELEKLTTFWGNSSENLKIIIENGKKNGLLNLDQIKILNTADNALSKLGKLADGVKIGVALSDGQISDDELAHMLSVALTTGLSSIPYPAAQAAAAISAVASEEAFKLITPYIIAAAEKIGDPEVRAEVIKYVKELPGKMKTAAEKTGREIVESVPIDERSGGLDVDKFRLPGSGHGDMPTSIPDSSGRDQSYQSSSLPQLPSQPLPDPNPSRSLWVPDFPSSQPQQTREIPVTPKVSTVPIVSPLAEQQKPVGSGLR